MCDLRGREESASAGQLEMREWLVVYSSSHDDHVSIITYPEKGLSAKEVARAVRETDTWHRDIRQKGPGTVPAAAAPSDTPISSSPPARGQKAYMGTRRVPLALLATAQTLCHTTL